MQIIREDFTGRDAVLAALVQGLEAEFGAGAGRALADRFLDAEEVDFLWDARLRERWLGSYEAGLEMEIELDRIAVFGRFDRHWFAAILIVDGGGRAHALLAKWTFARRPAAERAFADVR